MIDHSSDALEGAAKAISDAGGKLGKGKGRPSEFLGVVFVFVQVALVALIFRKLEIETHAFRCVLYVAAAGFLIHHLLPPRFRLLFFVALSIAAAFLVLGGNADRRIVDLSLSLPRTAVMLIIGAVLIAICRLPIGFWKRSGLLLLAGAIAAAFRTSFFPSGTLLIVWPVIAAMFMFRIIVYLYDVSHSPQPPAKSQSLAYFFLIPNVCTPLFPVIDFRTFCGKYYDEDALAIYQRGVNWMARGALHLILYRLIDNLLAIETGDIATGTDLIRFVITNSFLYLQVSGKFHLYAGMLLLFGFNLPETNHRYFLASSFSDYWRRVNTYWRHFIMKVFFYPAFFRFKKSGQVRALFIATLWAFFITWALHLYQTWWLTGTASLKWTDALFWAILGLLVLVNSLVEMKRGRQRKLATSSYGARDSLILAVRTAATFSVISVLWSLWSAPSLGRWLFIWRLADLHTLMWGGAAFVSIMIATVLFEALPAFLPTKKRPAAFLRPFLQFTALLAVVCYATFYPPHADRGAAPKTIRNALQGTEGLATVRAKTHNYYDNLTVTDKANRQFWETVTAKKFPFDPNRRTRDFCWGELIPNARGKYTGVDFQINRWGMRDRDYELQPPPGTFRMAFIGSSHLEGYGVEAGDMFKNIVNNRLNADHARNGRFESLNFAIGGISPIGEAILLQKYVPQFHPKVVLLVTHLLDIEWMARDLERGLREHVPIPDPYFNSVLSEANVDASTTDAIATERLAPYEPAMLSFCYSQMVRECHVIGVTPVCVFMPIPIDLPLDKGKAARLIGLAKDAGFIVIDLSDVFDGYTSQDLRQPDEMMHCNAKANALVASELFERLVSDPRIDLLRRARRTLAAGKD